MLISLRACATHEGAIARRTRSQLRFRNYVTTNIKYLAAYRKRNSGIARCSQRGCVRCALLVERSEFVQWSRLSRQLLALFPGNSEGNAAERIVSDPRARHFCNIS